nr:hypothetical protein [Tanacetum cinerariifolium]
MVNVLTSMDAANILTIGVQAVSVPPVAEVSTIGVPTGSSLVPTVSDEDPTARVVTPYSRRKREIEEQMAREDQKMDEQIARDDEIARIHAEEELQMLIDGIIQSKALSTTADEHASLLRDDSHEESFPTVSGLEARQNRENIIKTSALPHDSTLRVTSLDADEGSMQQQLQELTDLCTRL